MREEQLPLPEFEGMPESTGVPAHLPAFRVLPADTFKRIRRLTLEVSRSENLTIILVCQSCQKMLVPRQHETMNVLTLTCDCLVRVVR